MPVSHNILYYVKWQFICFAHVSTIAICHFSLLLNTFFCIKDIKSLSVIYVMNILSICYLLFILIYFFCNATTFSFYLIRFLILLIFFLIESIINNLPGLHAHL